MTQHAERLFVYGSLQPGGSNAGQLDGVRGVWRRARVRGRLVDEGWASRLGYPALILDDDAGEIEGHLFESAELPARWPALDAFEGPGYRRVTAAVTLDDGTGSDAWVYVSSGEPATG